jgi:transposase
VEQRISTFSRWSQKGVWQRIFEAMSDDPDFEYLIVDSTIVRAHQHASGAKRGSGSGHRTLAWWPEHQDPSGRPWPGVPGAIRAHGRPARRRAQAGALIEGLPAQVVMADTAYDADHFRQAIADKGALAVIPNSSSRARKHPLDQHLYAQSHLVECCFSKLKQFRRVATRFEKTARNYRAVITLASYRSMVEVTVRRT